LTVTISVSDPSDPGEKVPVKLHRLVTVAPEAIVCGSEHVIPVAQVPPATLLAPVHWLPAGQAGGSTHVPPPAQPALVVQELPALVPPEQAPVVAMLPYLLSQS
jgi:hypothetical protein